MSKKPKDSDLRIAGAHFRNALYEGIIGSAYLAKGIGDITKNRNNRQEILNSVYKIVDSGLSTFIKYAEERNSSKGRTAKASRKTSNRTRKIKID